MYSILIYLKAKNTGAMRYLCSIVFENLFFFRDRVALFVNGEYWNDVYLHERIDEKYFEDHYGVLPGNLLVLSESFPEIGRGRDEETWNADRAMYLDIGDFVSKNDISNNHNYEILQTMISEMMHRLS